MDSTKKMVSISMAILLSGILLVIGIEAKASQLTLDKVKINLEKISEFEPLKVIAVDQPGQWISKSSGHDQWQERTENLITVYTNRDQTFFLINKTLIGSSRSNGMTESYVISAHWSFFNRDGKKIWEKQCSLSLNTARINLEGKFVFIDSSNNDYESIYQIIILNGEVVYKEKNYVGYHLSTNTNAICFEIFPPDDRGSMIYKIEYYNTSSGSRWSKAFPYGDRLSFIRLSDKGEKVASLLRGKLYIWDKSGLEVWNKEWNKEHNDGYMRSLDLSFDGKYLLLYHPFGQLTVLDWQANKIDLDKNIGGYQLVYFINESYNFALVKPIIQGSQVVIMSPAGQVLVQKELSKPYNSNFVIKKNKNSYTIN